MLDAGVVADAVRLQEQSYRLLRWMAEAIPKGFINFDAAHHYASLAGAAQAWIVRHHADLPTAARPERDDIPRFARLFASYLESSFDLIAEPGMRKVSEGAHCFCPMCSWLVRAPNLQAKRVTSAIKRRADTLSAIRVRTYARQLELAISDDALVALLARADLREPIALTTYAHELLARLDGFPDGPAALALWRRFAWKPEGSPRPGFELRAPDIMAAEAQLIGDLRAAAASPAP